MTLLHSYLQQAQPHDLPDALAEHEIREMIACYLARHGQQYSCRLTRKHETMSHECLINIKYSANMGVSVDSGAMA